MLPEMILTRSRGRANCPVARNFCIAFERSSAAGMPVGTITAFECSRRLYLQLGIDEALNGTSGFVLRTVPSTSKYADPFGLSKAFIPHLSQ